LTLWSCTKQINQSINQINQPTQPKPYNHKPKLKTVQNKKKNFGKMKSGLNFHPPDNSAHHSQHGPSSGAAGSTTAASLSAANAAAAAAAAAAVAGTAPAPPSIPLGVAPSSATTSVYSGGLIATGHAPGTGLLASAPMSMQNLVTLLSNPQHSSSLSHSQRQHHQQHHNNNSSNSHSHSNSNNINSINNNNANANNNSQQRQLTAHNYATNAGQLVTHAHHTLNLAQLMGVAPPPPPAAASQQLTLSALCK